LETIAPAQPMPANPRCLLPGILPRANIAVAEVKVPAMENRKMKERNVPPISPWPSTFSTTSRKKSLAPRTFSARSRGMFASPIRMKGRGFGTRYSTAERKKQSAPSRARVFRRSPPCGLPGHGIDIVPVPASADVKHDPVGKAGRPLPGQAHCPHDNAGLIHARRGNDPRAVVPYLYHGIPKRAGNDHRLVCVQGENPPAVFTPQVHSRATAAA